MKESLGKVAKEWFAEHLLLGLCDGAAHAGHDDHGGVWKRAEDREEQAADEPGVHHLRSTRFMKRR